jgi:prevent-host-death family protein
MTWQLSVAKNKFSEVFERACSEGPQEITRRNERVFVISEKEYHHLKKVPDFKDFLLHQGPSLKGLDLSRDRSTARDIKL